MTIFKKISGLIRLFRPELPFAAGICVVVGEIIALGSFPAMRPLSLGFLCGFFLSGSALISNDYFDIEVDRINAPQRPYPSGLVTGREVIGLTILTALIGLAVSYFIGLSALILSMIFWLIGFLYNWKFKQSGLPGNLMVSSSVAVTYVLGGMVVGHPWNKIVWVFSLIAFLIDLGEEIAGDALDIAGDTKRGSRSIAIRLGKKNALSISGVIFGLVILISLLPALLGWLGSSYLVMIAIMDVLIAFFTFKLLNPQTSELGQRAAMRGLYLGALLGMLAFILGQFLA